MPCNRGCSNDLGSQKLICGDVLSIFFFFYFKSIFEIDEKYVYIEVGSNRKKESRLPFEDLFLWSVLMNRQDMAKLFWRQGKVNDFFSMYGWMANFASYKEKLIYLLVTLFFNIFTSVNLYIKLKKKSSNYKMILLKIVLFGRFWPCRVCQDKLHIVFPRFPQCGIQTVRCLITIMFFIEGCNGVRFVGVWDFKRNGDQDRRYRVT